MKNLTLVLLSFLSLSVCFAQKPLSNSRTSSYYTYIYRLTDADVDLFYSDKHPIIDERILRRPIDSSLTDRFRMPDLPPGNYVKVSAAFNKLTYSLIEKHSAYLMLLENRKDLRFTLLDVNGVEIHDASVSLNNHTVDFDQQLQLYRTSRSKRDTLIKVKYKEVTNYFSIGNGRAYHYKLPFWTWVRYKSPVKYVYPELSALFSGHRNRPIANYPGYMVFNKPMYKPGDTVKFKAYILNKRSKKPMKDKRLYIQLRSNIYNEKGKIIGAVNAYRDGAFESSFVLNDKLKLTLDEDYSLNLLKDSADIDKSNNSLQSGRFRYEDYELKSISFAARTDKEEGSPGSPISLYLKATDENNLPVADGRAEITVITQRVTDYYGQHAFVPDTLWRHKQPLDVVGETKIIIPDSLFPKVDLKYEVQSVFLNSNNERQQQYKQLTFNNNPHVITTKLDADTLKINYTVYGKDTPVKAVLTPSNANDDDLADRIIQLPAKIIVDPNMRDYTIKADSTLEIAELKDFSPNLSTSAYRTNDSLFIKVDNPRHIPFWYTIFSGSSFIDGGKATGLFYKKPYHHNGNAFMLLNYIWAGQPKSDEVTIVYRDKLLSINVKQPVAVSPGQQVPIEINVQDAMGKPVANADITAMALTTKFKNFYTPNIPYMGKLYGARKGKPNLQITEVDGSGDFALQWKRWSTEMGLDSIVYYRFTHPKDLFTLREPAPENVTQIAPFVVKDGDILPVHLLMIDERPVYFNQAGQLERYSFKVDSGYHKITFRTLNQSIELERVHVPLGAKLLLSVNADTTTNKLARFTRMPDTLSLYEAAYIKKYMIKVVNNFGAKMATLQQGDNVLLLNPNPGTYNWRNEILAGPLAFNFADFKLHGEPARSFETEPAYSFEFLPGLIKQKSISSRYPFNTHLLGYNNQPPGYKQYALTVNEVDSLWQQYLDLRNYSTQLFRNDNYPAKGNGQLDLSIKGYHNDNQPSGNHPLIKNMIVYRYDNPDYIRIYPGRNTDPGYLQPGDYRLLFLLKGDQYYIHEHVIVKPNGINHYTINFDNIKPRDSVSIKIADVINNRENINSINDDKEKLKIKEAFNAQYTDNATYEDEMTGIIEDEEHLKLPGASIIVSGTKYATQTDINGHFKIKVPPSGVLKIAFIGYKSTDIPIQPGKNVNIVLRPSANELQEVAVIGYGTMKRSELTGSITTINSALEGKVAGIMIRGANSISNAAPLVVVDGVVVDGGMAGIDPSSIADMSVLKDAAATTIYGSRGANGVVVITTTKKGNKTADASDPPGSEVQPTLRTNFSDYAYWQPKLQTDEHGIARFNTTFPDDITNWRTLVIAMGNKLSGYAEGQIKSFKPLSANLVAPQFALKGDEFNVIGKIMNYTTETANVNRQFKYNGEVIKQGMLGVKNSVIDTFKVVADNKDSLHFEYTIKKDNGYFDGERRSIPVFEQGVLETKGTFADMEGDTITTLMFDPALGPVTFRAEASVLPALVEEADHLRNYEYLCNEQLASKLKGLIAEKKIDKYMGRPFKWDKNVLEVIKKLQENRRTEGTWGWWKDTDEELWISQHAIEALLDAEKEGYAIKIDKQKMIDYLVYRAQSYRGDDKLDDINLLFRLGAKADYPTLIANYEKQLSPTSILNQYDSLKLMKVKLIAGLKVNLDSLLKTRHNTMFGNTYWGYSSYHFFDNSIQLSLLAYQIIKIEGKHADLLPRIRNYFLEQRKDGFWRNTYESSLILETILPDLLVGDKLPQPSAITLSGGKDEKVTQFPYSTTLTGTAQLTVSKTGKLPVYITGYQQFWNKNPVKVSKDFTVNTYFIQHDERITRLKGGEPVSLVAEVTARADADFVMIEIPIPAGCSYESKDQNYYGNEIHREYFKNKVSIFCRKLKQGKYIYTIKLMPRYGGNYTLNPAKAEMMYFPVFYGREDLKRVTVN